MKTLNSFGAAHVVAVARRTERDDLFAVHGSHLPGFERLDHLVRLRHRADPPIRFDAHRRTSSFVLRNQMGLSHPTSKCAAPRRRPARFATAAPRDGAHRRGTSARAHRPGPRRPLVGRNRPVREFRSPAATSQATRSRSRAQCARRRPHRKYGFRGHTSGQMCSPMFSMMPSTGTVTLRNISMPFAASCSAMSCGVVTITAPATAARCDKVSWMSPVPGGISTIEIVEPIPQRLSQHLRQRARRHRSTPYHRRFLRDEKAHRHRLQAVRLDRQKELLVLHFRVAAQPAHPA